MNWLFQLGGEYVHEPAVSAGRMACLFGSCLAVSVGRGSSPGGRAVELAPS